MQTPFRTSRVDRQVQKMFALRFVLIDVKQYIWKEKEFLFHLEF